MINWWKKNSAFRLNITAALLFAAFTISTTGCKGAIEDLIDKTKDTKTTDPVDPVDPVDPTDPVTPLNPETNLTLTFIGNALQASWTNAYPGEITQRDFIVYPTSDCSGSPAESFTLYFYISTTMYYPTHYGTFSYKIKTRGTTSDLDGLSSCSTSAVFNGAGFAKNLTWSEIPPYTYGVMVQALSANPTWTPAGGSANFGSQLIQYYNGQTCNTPIGGPVALSTSTVTTTLTPTVGTYNYFTFKITSIGINGAANSISACSAALYIDTHDQSATGLGWEQTSPYTGTKIKATWTSNLSDAYTVSTSNPNDIQFYQGNNCQNPVNERIVQNPVTRTFYLWTPPYPGTFTYKIFSGNGILGYPQQSACSAPMVFDNGSVWHGASANMLSQLPHSTSSVVWTGTEMIFWGSCPGADIPLAFAGTCTNVGKKYNPSSDIWTSTGISTTNAPLGRIKHSAVWTGSKMLIYGGYNSAYFNSAISQGYFLQNGGAYDPLTNTWSTSLPTLTNPTSFGEPIPSRRGGAVSVWTGSHMLIHGGSLLMGTNPINTGSMYNPSIDSWTSMTPSTPLTSYNVAFGAMAVWAPTVNKMIIYGGSNNPAGAATPTGKTFDPTLAPSESAWADIANGPRPTMDIPAFWNGTEMEFFRYKITQQDIDDGIFSASTFGGPNTNIQSDLYNPATNTWSTRAGEPPPYRTGYDVIYTGAPLNRVYLIGGYSGSLLNKDALYIQR